MNLPSSGQVEGIAAKLAELLNRDVMPRLRDGNLSLSEIEPTVCIEVEDAHGVGQDLTFALSVMLGRLD